MTTQTETQKNHSKKPNEANAAPLAKADGADEYSKVDLFRTYIRNGEWAGDIKVLLLQRSEDVSELYPKKIKTRGEPQPSFVWAMQLMEDVPNDGRLSQGEGMTVAGKKGDIVYFFEPSALAQFFRSAYASGFPVGITCQGKHKIQSRNFGEVNAWKWEVSCRKKKTQPLGGDFLVNLPALVQPDALPQSAAFASSNDEE